MYQIYDAGVKKYEKEFDIIRLIKNIRKSNIYLKGFISKKMKKLIIHDARNIIDIDTDNENQEVN